jgi:hypothetical protein
MANTLAPSACPPRPRSSPAPVAPAPEDEERIFKRLDSGLVDDELNDLTEDDLPGEILSSDVALRELEECLHQHQQNSGPHSGSDDSSDSA